MANNLASGFKREDAGIHTVEGTISGARAARLSKKREQEQREYEAKKQKIQDDYARGSKTFNEKFGGSASDAYESTFKMKTVGLVTADEFRKAREEAEQPGGASGAAGGTGDGTEKGGEGGDDKKEKKKTKKKKKKMVTLSFGEEMPDDDGDDAADGGNGGEDGGSNGAKSEPPKKKISKNPYVDTSFLPDREREEKVAAEKRRLQEEWMEQQEKIKQEMLNITYSYWDGTGHRREINIHKGATMGKFLGEVLRQISQEFTELRSLSGDQLLYVKEDLIIPQHMSFYDLIITKARGKSGPLFHFDVHDDIRLINDATVEKDESHPGKIVERRWYERNKHIFPASRWEVFDPNKDYGDYTIHGGEVQHDK